MLHEIANYCASCKSLFLSFATQLCSRLGFNNITHAHLQSKQGLSHDIYISVKSDDEEMIGLSEKQLLHSNKLLYSFCNVGDYWDLAMNEYLTKN